jgi:hypothetical protein
MGVGVFVRVVVIMRMGMRMRSLATTGFTHENAFQMGGNMRLFLNCRNRKSIAYFSDKYDKEDANSFPDRMKRCKCDLWVPVGLKLRWWVWERGR